MSDISIRRGLEKKIKKEFEDFVSSISEISQKLSENKDIVKNININGHFIEVETIVPIASCKCSQVIWNEVENENGELVKTEDPTFLYIIDCNCFWEEGMEVCFYGYCYKLKAIQNVNAISVKFKTKEDIRNIFYKMALSEIEYKLTWLLDNYTATLSEIENYFNCLDKIANLKTMLNNAEKEYNANIAKSDRRIEEFYNAHRYKSDGLIWERKIIKNNFRNLNKEITEAIWETNSEIKKYKKPTFDIRENPDKNINISCYCRERKAFYCI